MVQMAKRPQPYKIKMNECTINGLHLLHWKQESPIKTSNKPCHFCSLGKGKWSAVEALKWTNEQPLLLYLLDHTFQATSLNGPLHTDVARHVSALIFALNHVHWLKALRRTQKPLCFHYKTAPNVQYMMTVTFMKVCSSNTRNRAIMVKRSDDEGTKNPKLHTFQFPDYGNIKHCVFSKNDANAITKHVIKTTETMM